MVDGGFVGEACGVEQPGLQQEVEGVQDGAAQGEAGPQDLTQRRKAADLLARRGFDGDSIRRATRYDPDD